MKKNRILLNILSVICFIFGAFYIFTLVFIPIGIYCFVAGRMFSYKADHLLDNYAADKKTMKNYAWFISIVCFPLGLLSIIVYISVYGNNVKVDTLEHQKLETINDNVSENIAKEEDTKQEENQETEEEKFEKLEKLKNFKDKNIITEEEFEMAKEQILGKKDN